MATVHKSALVLYSAADMFALVNDVESYPKFLPWCRSARVFSRHPDEIMATIQMVKGAIDKTFTTCNRIQQNKMIEMRLLDGPFRHLEGFWRFEVLRHDACKVSLDMEFEFSNKVLRIAVGPVFNQIVNSLVDAFCKRAVEVYGKR